jgi:Zn finger protein HypA/HybF involved in hydrogenase expression
MIKMSENKKQIPKKLKLWFRCSECYNPFYKKELIYEKDNAFLRCPNCKSFKFHIEVRVL